MRSSDRHPRHPQPQSTTSLPRAPRDGEATRLRRYLITMGIRIACFILAVVIQPFGWWTWILLSGAIFLPYFAVIVANVGMDATAPVSENPERMLTAAPSTPAAAAAAAPPAVILLSESPIRTTPPPAAPAADPPGTGR